MSGHYPHHAAAGRLRDELRGAAAVVAVVLDDRVVRGLFVVGAALAVDIVFVDVVAAGGREV